MLVVFFICFLSIANVVIGMEQEQKNKAVMLLMKTYSQQDLAEQYYDLDKMWNDQTNRLARAGVNLQSKDLEIKSLKARIDEVENEKVRKYNLLLETKYNLLLENNKIKEGILKEKQDLKMQIQNKDSENEKLSSENKIVNCEIEILRKKIVQLQNDSKLISENNEKAIKNNLLLLQKIKERDNKYRELEKHNQELLLENQELKKKIQATKSKVAIDINQKAKIRITEEMKKRLIEEAQKPLTFEEAIDEQENFHLSMVEAYLISPSNSMMQSNPYVEKALVEAYKYLFGDKN